MSKRALRIVKSLAKPSAVFSAIVISGASVASAADLQKVTVRMDWVVSAYHAPFYAGVKNGFFKDQGLDVTVQPGNGSANVAQALGHGNGEFASVDGGTMMQLVAKGLPVKCVMGYYQRNPNGVIYAEKSGIK
ncbi:ABC transporter substrate-binding protein, partial [Bradyrhizobium sp.]|uniref:ABC transporter substrate-binding protein n=1 Tax=Bradyrhizobium sp. TaxID=376 RepID=UPI003C48E1AB